MTSIGLYKNPIMRPGFVSHTPAQGRIAPTAKGYQLTYRFNDPEHTAPVPHSYDYPTEALAFAGARAKGLVRVYRGHDNGLTESPIVSTGAL